MLFLRGADLRVDEQDDFFGQSPMPRLSPAADLGTPARPSTAPFFPLIVGAVVVALALIGFVGYRMFLAGPRIDFPDQLMGM
ncbi:MAG: hypothetical protein ABI632_13845, partial [Pseudolysinimonas sp.]